MTDVATLLSEYVDALSGGAAPQVNEFLSRAASQEERIELAEAIDVILDFAPDEVRHPRSADGTHLLGGVSSEQIAAAAATPWNEAMPAWRAAAGMTIEQLAEQALSAGNLAADDENRSAARRWIEAMESGAESARTISVLAMDAIADAIGVARDAFKNSGAAVTPGAVAFRKAGSASDARRAAEGIEVVAEALADAMPPAESGAAVDDWFRRT